MTSGLRPLFPAGPLLGMMCFGKPVRPEMIRLCTGLRKAAPLASPIIFSPIATTVNPKCNPLSYRAVMALHKATELTQLAFHFIPADSDRSELSVGPLDRKLT